MTTILADNHKTMRNFRLKNSTWENAQIKAKDLNVSMTFLVEYLLQKFTRNPRLVIESMEVMETPLDIQEKIENLSSVAEKAISKRKKCS